MGSNSSSSSNGSSSSSNGFTISKKNDGVDRESQVTEIIEKHEYKEKYKVNSKGERDPNGIEEKKIPSGHKFYVVSISYYYKQIGYHRIIQFWLKCNECGCGWFLYMDKTCDAKKNIDISKEDFFEYNNQKDGYWTYWNYFVKKNKTFSYEDCLRLFHDAPSGYHLIKNNCADFARYIWKNAPY